MGQYFSRKGMGRARKRITEQALSSWDEVNSALKAIGDAQLGIQLIETDLNAAITGLKDEAKEKVKAHEEVVKLNELMIQQYVSEHKGEMRASPGSWPSELWASGCPQR